MNSNRLPKQFSRFESVCRNAGLKLTHQRLEIYRELVSSEDHPSAETLHNRLSKKIPTLSLDTVYRTLAAFTRHCLAYKVETVESHARFDAREARHHHAICKQCHEIMDFPCPSLDDDVGVPKELESWGKIDSKNLVVHGICKKCLKIDRSLKG